MLLYAVINFSIPGVELMDTGAASAIVVLLFALGGMLIAMSLLALFLLRPPSTDLMDSAFNERYLHGILVVTFFCYLWRLIKISFKAETPGEQRTVAIMFLFGAGCVLAAVIISIAVKRG